MYHNGLGNVHGNMLEFNQFKRARYPIVFKSFTRSVHVKGAEIFTSRNYTLRQLSYKILPQ